MSTLFFIRTCGRAGRGALVKQPSDHRRSTKRACTCQAAIGSFAFVKRISDDRSHGQFGQMDLGENRYDGRPECERTESAFGFQSFRHADYDKNPNTLIQPLREISGLKVRALSGIVFWVSSQVHNSKDLAKAMVAPVGLRALIVSRISRFICLRPRIPGTTSGNKYPGARNCRARCSGCHGRCGAEGSQQGGVGSVAIGEPANNETDG